MSKITHLQCHKALKAALTRNFKFHWLDVEFGQHCITWYMAIQTKGDAEQRWHPKIAMFYPKEQRVCVLERIGAKPMWMDVEVLVAMATPTTPDTPTVG